MFSMPLPILVITFAVLCVAAWLGATRFEKLRSEAGALRQEFGVIQNATLTLLGLIVGFTFSMALDRYEQRKDFEAAEANAILTAYQRADLLPPADGDKVRTLLRSYLQARLRYFDTRNPFALDATNAATATPSIWARVPEPSVTTASIIRVNCAATSGVTACDSSCGSVVSITDRSDPMTDCTR